MVTNGNPLTDHLDLWTSALLTKSTAGRGSNSKLEAYGIKKLRELILELAVRGRLVPQDANNERAEVLLCKIVKERDYLAKEGRLKKPKNMPAIVDNEIPYALPNGWEWVRLGQIISISSGDGLTSSEMTNSGKIPVYGGNGVTGYHDKANVTKPTLVIGRVGYYCGSIHITPASAWVTDNAFVTSFSEDNICLDFLAWLLKGTNLKENENATAQPVISGRKVYPIVVGLPPLDEQYRIVAKVDELMTLCDRLEQQQAGGQEAHQTLVETLLGTLTQSTVRAEPVEARPSTSSGRTEFEEAWTRIADHFDTLFTTEHSIDQLKQTILQLAVMGKLVPQDPGDEPASTLLSRIAKQKEWLVDNRIIRKQKLIPAITREEIVLNLPMGWEWCRLQDIVYVLGDGLHGTPEYTPNERFHFVNGNNLVDGEILIKPDTKTVAVDQYEKYKKPLGNNSVLVSINGTLGSVAFYNNEDIILGKSACFFNLAEDIYKSFIKVVLDAPSFTVYAEKNSTGTTIKNLGLGAMNSFAGSPE